MFIYLSDSISIFLVSANFGTHFLSTITTGARVTTTSYFSRCSELRYSFPINNHNGSPCHDNKFHLVAANFGTHFLSTITTGARVTTTSFISEEATNSKEESMLERCLAASVNVKSAVASGKDKVRRLTRKCSWCFPGLRKNNFF